MNNIVKKQKYAAVLDNFLLKLLKNKKNIFNMEKSVFMNMKY